MRSGGIVVIVGVLAVVGLAWFFLGGDDARPIDDGLGFEDGITEETTGDGEALVSEDDGDRLFTGTDGSGGGSGDPMTSTTNGPSSDAVAGRVVNTDGKPIVGATVYLYKRAPGTRATQIQLDGEPLLAARSAQNGSFSLGPAPASSALRVRAQAAGYAPGVADVAVRGGHVEIILDRGGTMRVRVVNESSEPLVGAAAVYSVDKVSTNAKTDAEGVVNFTALPMGKGVLIVSADGYRSARDDSITVRLDDEQERTLVLSEATMLEGVVNDAETKRPITGAQVSLSYPTLPATKPEASVATDDKGKFRILNHAGERDRIQFQVRKAGYAEARRVRSGTDTSALVLELHRGLDAFQGIVYSSESLPAEGVTVTYGQVGGLQSGEEPPQTRTNDAGEFKLAPPSWAVRGTGYQIIALSDAGEVGQRYVSAPKNKEDPPAHIEIRLVGSGMLKGRVLGTDGSPVDGAMIELEPDWSQRSRAGGALHMQVFKTLRDRQLMSMSTVTDNDGNYLFMQVPSMAFRATASHGQHQDTSDEAVVITPGGMSELNITLGSGKSIEGWVNDDRGEPVPGAQIRAIPQDRRGGMPTTPVNARTLSDGTYVLRGVGNGTYQISASMPGFGSATVKDVQSGQTNVELVLPQRGRVMGQVLQDGRPYSGTFSAEAKYKQGKRASMGPGGTGFFGGTQGKRTFNSDDGRFELSGLASGTYVIHVSTSKGLIGASDPVDVKDGSDSSLIRVPLSAGSSLHGNVVDGSGQPIANAWVHAWPAKKAKNNNSASNASVRSGADGSYRLVGLGAGKYNVTIWAKGRNWSVEVDIRQGDDRAMNLTYKDPGAIEIVVVDTDDNPLEGARPDVETEGGVRVHANYQAAKRDGLIQDPQDWAKLQQTDASGRVTRHHVPPGKYIVSARKAGYADTGKTAAVSVSSGGKVQARVVLKRAEDDDR